MKRKCHMLAQKGYYYSGMESYNGKIEVIPFVEKPNSKLSIVNVEITIQELGGGCTVVSFISSSRGQMNSKYSAIFCAFHRQYIIYISEGEIKLLCKLFLASLKRELILVLFVRLFGLCLFRFAGFLFLLGSGKGCGL